MDQEPSDVVQAESEKTDKSLEQKHGSGRFLKPIFVWLAFLLIITSLVIFGLSTSLKNKKQTPKISPSTVSTAQIDSLTSNILGSDIARKVTIVKFDASTIVGSDAFYYAPSKHYILVSTDKNLSYDYQVVPKNEAIMPTDDELLSKMSATLIGQGYTQYHEPGTVINKTEAESKILRYQKESIACILEVFHSQEQTEDKINVHMNRKCVNKDNFEKEYSQVKPFIQAYEQSNTYKNSPFNEYFLNMMYPIKQSVTAGYEYITGGYGNFGGGSAIIFYRHVGGDWVYAYITQSILACSSYDNQDMQLALADQQCVGKTQTDNFTTVKAYYGL